jgi:hypothetical protein
MCQREAFGSLAPALRGMVGGRGTGIVGRGGAGILGGGVRGVGIGGGGLTGVGISGAAGRGSPISPRTIRRAAAVESFFARGLIPTRSKSSLSASQPAPIIESVEVRPSSWNVSA